MDLLASDEFVQEQLENHVCEGDVRLLEKTASQLSLHVSDQARPTLQQLIAETRARLRRAVAAHWRCVSSAEEEEEALDAILYSRHLGIVDFCKRAEAPSLPCCITAVRRRSRSPRGQLSLSETRTPPPTFLAAVISPTIMPNILDHGRAKYARRCLRMLISLLRAAL